MLNLSTTEEAWEAAARAALEAADSSRNDWKVLWARGTCLRGISPSVAAPRYPLNVTGAAKALGKPVATVRPYILAGKALAQAGRVQRTSPPEQTDLKIVEAAMDEAARRPRRSSSRASTRNRNR